MPEATKNESVVTDEGSAKEDQEEKVLSIGNVIDGFLHQVLDIEDCGRDYVAIASEKYKEYGERINAELTASQEIIENDDDEEKNLHGKRGVRSCLLPL